MPRFSDQVWADTAPLRAQIDQLSFIRRLTDGTLKMDVFRHYMIQDALYLTGYARALSFAAMRAPNPEEQVFLADSAKTAIVVERALHGSFFEAFGVSEGEVLNTPMAPTCQAYTDYLMTSCVVGSYGVGIAAILPCFWIYQDVGARIAAGHVTPNPYAKWIETYSDEGFAEATRTAIAIMDRAADDTSETDRAAMRAAFVRSSQYEWMFWDAADRLERWPV